jgi:hypothetical protein
VSVAPLPSVVSQNTIELHAIGHLRDLGSLRIVRILCRRDQQVVRRLRRSALCGCTDVEQGENFRGYPVAIVREYPGFDKREIGRIGARDAFNRAMWAKPEPARAARLEAREGAILAM